jgi:hypothetical protein
MRQIINIRRSMTALVATLILCFASISMAQAQTANDNICDFNGDGKSDWSVVRRPGLVSPLTWYIRHNGEENFIAMDFGLVSRDRIIPADYDGDRKTDIAVWSNTPPAGQLSAYYILNSSTNTMRVVTIGRRLDVPVPADYDGDGKVDPAVFDAPKAGEPAGPAYWRYVGSLNNPNNTITSVHWGMKYGDNLNSKDEPYPGDFDGDGRADFRVQRPVDITQIQTGPAVFYTLTADGNISYNYFGDAEDRVVPGDYDGDGKTDIAVVRGFNIAPSRIVWHIDYTSNRADESLDFGEGSNFRFAQGDYDGDGQDDICFLVNMGDDQLHYAYRPSSNPSEGYRSYPWGLQGDLPAAGYNNR